MGSSDIQFGWCFDDYTWHMFSYQLDNIDVDKPRTLVCSQTEESVMRGLVYTVASQHVGQMNTDDREDTDSTALNTVVNL